MGILQNIRKKQAIEPMLQQYYSMITGYSPIFRTFEGGIYEMELTRAAIHTFAEQVSKLKPEVKGSGNKRIEKTLQIRPNVLMNTQQYLYRLATIFEIENNALITPLYDDSGTVEGFYPLVPSKGQFIEYEGVKYFRYQFDTGLYGAIEFEKLGRLTKFQYKNELSGENNAVLIPTLELMNAQNQGYINGIKNSAAIRFLAQLANNIKPKDIKAERERITKENLSSENNGGILLFDSKYKEIKQITSEPYTVDAKQMEQIQENVFTYFGTNKKIIQNSFNSDEWNAYYEGKIEPFALQMALEHTNILFSPKSLSFGNEVLFTANRLQYLSNIEKRGTLTDLFDRGFISHNQGLEIFNMAPVEGGDKRYIRKEYAISDSLNQKIEYEELK